MNGHRVAQQLAEALRGLLTKHDPESKFLTDENVAARTALAAWDAKEDEPSEYPEGTHVWTVENPNLREIPGGLQAVTFTPKVGFWPHKDNRKDGEFFWVRLSRDGTEFCLPSESVATSQPVEKV